MADPLFKVRVRELRGVMTSAAAGRLAATLGRAVRVLADLLRSSDPTSGTRRRPGWPS